MHIDLDEGMRYPCAARAIAREHVLSCQPWGFQLSELAIINVKYSFSRMSIRNDARCHLDHSNTLFGIDHSEVLVYLWQM